MIKVDINPLSVNAAWMGRRRKTQKYKDYEEVMDSLLPEAYKVPDSGNLFIYYKWGLSNTAFDWDNPIKCFQDILQTKYNFNDKRIITALVEKERVAKGDEYVAFFIRDRDKISIDVYDMEYQVDIYND